MYVPLTGQPTLALLKLFALFLLLRPSLTSENRTASTYRELNSFKRASLRDLLRSDQERRSSSITKIGSNPVNQLANQLTNQAFNRLANPPANQLNNQSNNQPFNQLSNQPKKPKETDQDEPMISMASNVVPKYFSNQQKAYHQQFDQSLQPAHKKVSKPKLGQQITLDHQSSSYNNLAESSQSSSILFGGSFHSEFGKEYPYKPTFLRFNPADGRTELDTKPPSNAITSRMDGSQTWKNGPLLDKKHPASSNLDINYAKDTYKPNDQMVNYPPKSPTNYPPNHQPNYNDPNDKYEPTIDKYEPTSEQALPTVKEPQITYSKHAVAMPLYSNYQPPPVNQPPYGEEPSAYPNGRESYDPKYSSPANQPSMTYSAPSYLVNQPVGQPMSQPMGQPMGHPPPDHQVMNHRPMGHQPAGHQPVGQPPMLYHKPNYKPKEYNPANYQSKPKYVIEHKPVNNQPIYSPEDKSLEKTIADLPNILGNIPGLLPDAKQFVTAPIRIDTPKLDYKPNGDNMLKPVQILVHQAPKPMPVMYQQQPPPPHQRPPAYTRMNQNSNLKESEEAHKRHQYDSHTMVSNLNGNNFNRLHKDEFYSNNNGYQATHYVSSSKDVRPYTTYMNNSELSDYESSYSETRYIDEAKRLNDTKDYYLVYKVDDRRLDDELNEKYINHHLSSAEERINNDYHEVINLSPMIEGDGLEKLFTIDTMNSMLTKDTKNTEFGSNEVFVDHQTGAEPHRPPNGRLYDKSEKRPYEKQPYDKQPYEKQPNQPAVYHSMRNRDQYKQFTAEDGREVHLKYGGQPASYDPHSNYQNLPAYRSQRKNHRSIDSLDAFETDSTHHTPDLKRISSSLGDLKYRHNMSDHSFGYRNNQTTVVNRPIGSPDRSPERPSDKVDAPIPHHYIDRAPIEPNRFEPERSRLDHSERIYLFSNAEQKQLERSPNNYAKNQDKPEFGKFSSPEYKLEVGKQDFKPEFKPEYQSDYKNERYRPDYKPSEYIKESFKSEFNDQTHKKESSVLKVKSYDEYLHENYAKADLRPGGY